MSLSAASAPLAQSLRNIFGISRQYSTPNFPSHDPEDHIELQSLLEVDSVRTDPSEQDELKNPFFPFPNENSFLLGNWYWNHGIQKTNESFRALVDIVGRVDFNPSDIRSAAWTQINKDLGRNDFDNDNNEVGEDGAWMDEDAGWKRTSIQISVPFGRRAKIPGPQDYIAGDLYHRSLVSVIREKLANVNDDRHFHYEPFKLLWQPAANDPSIRIHGEMYTSPAFLDAHSELQSSPREPGCDLPKVVVAMMFWSDATHLTSFGNAKLWPCYLSFGNESKYRRSKPTCHLLNHVAYFQSVSNFMLLSRLSLSSRSSSQTPLKTLQLSIRGTRGQAPI